MELENFPDNACQGISDADMMLTLASQEWYVTFASLLALQYQDFAGQSSDFKIERETDPTNNVSYFSKYVVCLSGRWF